MIRIISPAFRIFKSYPIIRGKKMFPTKAINYDQYSYVKFKKKKNSRTP